MGRRFKATIVVRRFSTVWRAHKLIKSDGKVIYCPKWKQLFPKLMREVKRGASIEVRFRKPCEADKVRFAVEVADIVLTWPD